jgi:diguanylate cyclase (GGDEF)-like protein
VRPENLDALIVASGTQMNFQSVDEFRGYLDSLKPLPVVSIGVGFPGVPSVVAASGDGFGELLRHLYQAHGCRNLVALSSLGENPDIIARRNALLAFLRDFDIPPERVSVIEGNLTEKSGYEAVKAFLAAGNVLPDAFVSMNDMMALGAMRYLRERGISVPEDVIVTGYDDLDRSRYSSPSLSTVSQDLGAQGRLAAELALAMLAGERVPPSNDVPTRCLFRESCGCVGPEARNPALPRLSRFDLEDDLLQLRFYLGHLQEVQSIPDLMANLRTDLEYFHMKSCAICLYPHPIECARDAAFRLPERAELILAYDEGVSYDARMDPGRYFNPLERIIPKGLFSARARVLVTTALYHRESQLGYIIYEPGDMSPSIYEALCVQLSKGISSALVFTEKLSLEAKLGAALGELEEKNALLLTLSRTDDLTGLLNRRGFLDQGQQCIDLSLRMNRGGLVIFGDLDGLKAINDAWGHEAGDRAISAVADALKKAFRSVDAISRLSGDEFAVVAADTRADGFPALRERIDEILRDWKVASGEPYALSISLGFVEYTESVRDLRRLLSLADTVLYAEKRKRKARSLSPSR